MRFHILGPLQVTEDGERLGLGGPKQRLVLAHLLVRANEVVSADRLIDEIWGQEPPDAARSSLHSYVSHLRQTLGRDRLVGRPPGYVLRASDTEIDSLRFESLVVRARARLGADPGSAARDLREALGLWAGDPLADLSTELSLQPEIERLSEMRIAAQEELFEAELALGRHAELMPELQRLVGRNPLRERLCGQLMLALYRTGRQADALAAYHRLRMALDAELGLDPSPAIDELQRQILSHDPALERRGEPLRGYRLVERIGSGRFGVVHRAIEPQTERDVAIKVLGREIANDGDFVRRFDAEAGRVFRLEHPHVVPLRDWWREPDAAYLVMRLMRGGSLRERLARGRVTSAAALAWAEQIGGALAAAHRQGIAHGEIRPGNVLFDEDDNAYLSDFSTGHDAALANRRRVGRDDAYLAPERQGGEPPNAAADVFGLAVLLAELLQHVADVDHASLESVLDRARSVAAGERPADATELVAAVRRAILVPSTTTIAGGVIGGPPRNPYKGLRPFEESDAQDFVGREALIEQLVTRLGDTGDASRLLAVVGPSGSGKSSVVRAGLIPALRRGAIAGSEQWLVATMTPGHAPFEQLERAFLGIAVNAPAAMGELLEDEQGLRPAVERVLPEGTQLLLMVDQFEELFTLADLPACEQFLTTIARTVGDAAAPLRVVITLRADFYDRPLRHEHFGRQLASRTHAVPPLTPEELERAVTEPASRAGLRLETGLVARIVAEMSEQPGGLPLLQFALTELWERRDGSTLSLRAYDASGGIAGAVGRRAERLVTQMDREGREAARQLFLRLIEPGEGTPDTSRRVRRAELEAVGGPDDGIGAVIDTFARYRLLLFDRDSKTREPTIELAHEALLRAWPRLQQWVDDARDDVRTQRRLSAAATQWIEGGRDASFLLTGSRLDQTEQWSASTRILPVLAEQEYLAASVAERERLEADEVARQAHEAALERRAVNRLRALVVALGLGALLAGALSVYALGEGQRAAREARIATARELAAASTTNIDVDPERAVLLALEAIDETRSLDGTVLPEAEEALHWALVNSRVVLTVAGEGTRIDWSRTTDGGSVFVTAGIEESGMVTIRDAMTGEPRHSPIRADAVDVNDVAFAPDGSLFATAGDDGSLRLWRTATGESETSVEGAADAAVWGPSFNSDGSLVAATWWQEGLVRVLDLRTDAVREIPVPDEPWKTDFSPDGRRLAVTARSGPARVIDIESGETLFQLGDEIADDVDFSPDGRWIATSTIPGPTVWNASDGTSRQTLYGHTGEILTVVWSHDSTRLATASLDGAARVWEIFEDGYRQLFSFSSQDMTGGVEGVAFSPEGDRLMTGDGSAGAVKVWDLSLSGDAEWMNLPAEADWNALDVLPDGRLVASSGGGEVTIWGPAGETQRMPWKHDFVIDIVASPDGDVVASAGFDETRIWEIATGDVIATAHAGTVRGAAWSPDGQFLALSVWDSPTVRIVDRAGRELATFEEEAGFTVANLAFRSDDQLAVVNWPAGPRPDPTRVRVRLWNWREAQPVGAIAIPALGNGMDLDPARRLLATSHAEGVRLTDLETGEWRMLAGHSAGVSNVTFSWDGSRIASTSTDATVRIWDVATGRTLLVLRGHDDGVGPVRFSPDGSRLATMSWDGTLRVWALDLDHLIELARDELTRGFSDEECRQYLRLDSCPPE